MKILKGSIIPVLALSSLIASANAQEYFREYGGSRYFSGIGRLSPATDIFTGNEATGLPGITPVDQMAEEENYNMRIGNFDFILAAGLGVEVNDNINLSDHDRQSDVIFRPELDLEGIWRISENNKLRIGVGLSYAKYLDHDEFDSDGVLISPTSAITWSVRHGNFTITLREHFSYQEDPFEEPQINQARYRRWENQAGVEVDWAASEYTNIAVGYDRYDLWAQDEIFKSQDRGIDTIFFRPSYQLSPSIAIGLSTSFSWVNYKEDLQADSTVLLVGPYIRWRITDVLNLYAEVGYQRSDFDGRSAVEILDPDTGLGTGRFVQDESDEGSVYAKMELVHAPTENFRHKLIASKTTELGLGSNFYDLYHVEYVIDWKIREHTAIRPSLFYEYYETSGDFSEQAHRFGAALGIYQILSDHLTIGLDYRYLRKDSNLPNADYYQNLGMLSIYYKF
jgi:opacity protein-like surface antigen